MREMFAVVVSRNDCVKVSTAEFETLHEWLLVLNYKTTCTREH